MHQLACVPPSPKVMSMLYMDYLRDGQANGLTFSQYLQMMGYANPAHDLTGMDDAATGQMIAGQLELIAIPDHPITGQLHVKVLLVDFPDKPGLLPRQRYEDLLFSQGQHLTGSMYDYFREVSLTQVEITGSVHGWFRMPQPYSFYTNHESGIFGENNGMTSYPRNAQRLAEDAVRTALNFGVPFEPELDKMQRGVVTALFIVHAGRGAETLHPQLRLDEIWSHKFELRTPIQVGPDLFAVTYLTVPQECDLGVCAHELGHLAFQWQDFYDPNGADDGVKWSGSGEWDLMASGSYNGGSASPAHPAGLHKSQHGWVATESVQFSQGVAEQVELEIDPYSTTQGKVVKLISPHYLPGQYLLLENRTRVGFDRYLPGEGLLVWRVDESGEMFAPGNPGMLLVQADALHHLESNGFGDAGDPFPGSTRRTQLKSTGRISTSFPGQTGSGLSLATIRHSQVTGKITLRVDYDGS